MYIKKYWGNFIGGSDDSLNLVAFLEDQKTEEIALSEIFSKVGLDKQNWDFRQTAEYLEFTHSNGVEMDFHFAIDLITDLAAILLECSVSGSVNLQDLDEYNTPSRRIRITATSEEHDAMNKVLEDFVHAPLEYDLSEMMGEDEITDMAYQVEMLRKELYEASGRNRNYCVAAEEMKELLPHWEGAEGCLASNRIMVEGCQVGYCYREEPDGGWDSGWRFTAGDESDAYINDPNNVGIYALNTVCNDDPDIIPLLHTPAPCAFERDENGVFRQIKDWEPEQDEEESTMDILQQCQKWNEDDEHQKIVDALEAIPAEERTPEMDSELARAYGNLAEPGERELLKKAIALLKPHEEYFADDHCWNFRMGYSYYYLDQEGRALRYFEKALEARPGDEDTQEFIDWCKKGTTLPCFSKCFRERTESAWEMFVEQEAELRQIMDEDETQERGEELIAKCGEILQIAFEDVSFELGYNGEKYELILTPEGDKVKLFELVYFQKHTPKEVLEHWNILVGRQRAENIALRAGEWDISGEDVQIWLEEIGENRFALEVYCEKLLPMLAEEENRVWWMLTTLTDQVMGEIPNMRYIDTFDVLAGPKAEPSEVLSHLPDMLKEKGLDLSTSPEAYLASYIGYQMEPEEDPEADWRLDTIAGSTCCAALINGYLNHDNDHMDELHADGVAAGFFCYPLDTLREEEGSQRIFDFRDKLEERLTEGDGEEALTLIGGATGIYCGYVDFIAWDIRTALQMAMEFFADTEIPWISFHTFRREAGSVYLKDSEEDTKERENELEETLTGMDYIPYTPQSEEAFFAQIEQWNDEDEYTRCIQALNAIPKDWRNYRTAYALARALENYAIIGDHEEGTPGGKGDQALLRAIDVLEAVREEGQEKAEWNMRMAYAYQYLHEQEEKAILYAKRWMELDSEDENAPLVIRECEQEMKKRNRRAKGKKKIVLGETPFEGFDLTNFWDDNWYAQKEYISEPPSDELIADVEKELGYKLPDSYIWLMKQHNGGIPVNTCYPCDEPTCWAEDHVAITGIFGIGREKSCSLCGELGSQFMIDEWEYPAIGVAVCDCPSGGHDMIFLDYRACGPQGEPAVVHVDQENDYKITHLADSFEEFIRGLENESVFDIYHEDFGEEDAEGKKGAFVGSVLLSKAEWDKEQFMRDLQEEWGIVDEEPNEDSEDAEDDSDAVVMRVDNMMLIATLFPHHIPNNEAEINAENNYMWEDAVKVAKAHEAHILVAVLGEEEKLLEKGKLFTKALAVCCKQKYATGVCTSGVVFEPCFYEGFADMMKEDELPIFNWIWFGLYRSEGGLNGYTYGMDVFGKEEMEVLNADAEPSDLRDFLASLASYVLACDVTLKDGETIGFSADDKHTITRSPGISLPEEQMTLKISWEPLDGDSEDDEEDDPDREDNKNGENDETETGSLLSAQDIETLESFDDGISGYFVQMLQWLENFIEQGVSEGRFTEKQARQDLQIALWYSFACNNLDSYRYYYQAVEWMKDSEQNAKGCGTWYYRYSVALMYCGRLKESMEYAEKGIREEPDYPWIWLQAGKLRAHFGDKAGALEAVERGLAIEPGDYEFTVLQEEIKAGATLEQMEYHWIDPDLDQQLQMGLDEDADEKQRSISCITVSQKGLEDFWQIFGPKTEEYVPNNPFTHFPYRNINLVFRMNEGGMSKLSLDWLRKLKGWLDSGDWLERKHKDGRIARLDTVSVGLDCRIGLLYQLPEQEGSFQIFIHPDGTEQEDILWTSEGNSLPEVYTEAEMETIERHIQQYFGEVETVFHELVSPDIHVDICMVPPSEERDYYTLVTMGMGAHRMNVPKELAGYKLERAELAIALPKDWKLDQKSMKEERWYWPIRLLKSMARLPINCDSWLGHGHTVENKEPFADNTNLCTAILIALQGVEEDGEVCTLSGDEEVNFYQVIPLYADELDYKLEHGADALLEKMAGISFVVNPTRQDAITRGTLSDDDFDGEMDDAFYHIESIEEKELPIDPINAYNHMAIYLRWCMEHDLMGEEFLAECSEVVQQVKADPDSVDLRVFIQDDLDGCLFSVLFNQKGRAFAGYYYGENDSPYYPADVDDNALRFFGSERYHSDEFQDEAYLFIPFDEDYYQTMAKVIEERFENWQGQDFDEDTLEPSETAQAIMEYLDCECTYFPSMADDDPIMSAYSYAKRNSAKEGFVPMLIRADDEILLECLVMNADPENDADCYEFDLKAVEEYRKKMLAAPIKDGKAILEELIGQRKEEAEDDDMDWKEEVLGEMEGGYDNCRFSSYWGLENHKTYPVILAKIPVKHPWEIFAYLPFGNWNECPDTPELMAIAKYWFEQYGAIPAAMSHDELEFELPTPVSKEKAMELAAEQYGFCPDVVDQEQDDPTVGSLADVLWQSTVWYFWWD